MTTYTNTTPIYGSYTGPITIEDFREIDPDATFEEREDGIYRHTDNDEQQRLGYGCRGDWMRVAEVANGR